MQGGTPLEFLSAPQAPQLKTMFEDDRQHTFAGGPTSLGV
jgi:hypothetical protein